MLDRETGMRVFACVATQLFGHSAAVVAVDPPRLQALHRRII